MCGDSTKVGDVKELLGDAKVQMIFTDPPYGIDYSGGRTQVVAKKEYGKIEGDKEVDITPFINAIMTVANGIDTYICISPINLAKTLERIGDVEGIIVWKKPSPGLGYQFIRRYCEFILFTTDRKKAKDDPSEFDFWDVATDNRQDYEHGTQKPVGLSGRAIKYSSNEGEIVLDLFGGSGSTLMAAEQLNRTALIMELDPHYVDVIRKRYHKLTNDGNEAGWQEATPVIQA